MDMANLAKLVLFMLASNSSRFGDVIITARNANRSEQNDARCPVLADSQFVSTARSAPSDPAAYSSLFVSVRI
jgi:hypothetical protein